MFRSLPSLCVIVLVAACGDDAGTQDTDGSTGAATESGDTSVGSSASSTTSTTLTGTTDTPTGSGPTTRATSTGPDEPGSTGLTTGGECEDDRDCVGPTAPVCDPVGGACVECYEASHCTSAACDDLGQCVPGEAIAVVVGYGARRAMSADGVTWSGFVEIDPNGGDDENLLRGIGYGDGVFVAVGGAGGGLSMTSADGLTWENEDRNARAFISDTVWSAGMFIAGGGNGLRLRSTDHGATWQDETPSYSGHFRAIATDGTRAVAVGHTYGDLGDQGLTSTTDDGVAWSVEETGGEPFRSIAFGNGVFVAVGDAGRVSTSADGSGWVDDTVGADAIRDVAFAQQLFVVATAGGYWQSADGTDWQLTRAANPRPVAAYFRDAYLAVGWPAAVFRAEVLGAWDPVFDVAGSGLTQIAVGVPSGR